MVFCFLVLHLKEKKKKKKERTKREGEEEGVRNERDIEKAKKGRDSVRLEE